MKRRSPAMIGFLVGCITGLCQISSWAQEVEIESIFGGPVQIEMNLTVLNQDGSQHEAFSKTAYLSENSWYQESFGLTVDALRTPFVNMKLWDGSIYKSLTTGLEPKDDERPTYILTEKYKPGLREINPLLWVYHSFSDTTDVMTEGVTLFPISYLGKEWKARIEQNKEISGFPNDRIIIYGKSNMNIPRVTIQYEDFGIDFRDRLFPKRILYTFHRGFQT